MARQGKMHSSPFHIESQQYMYAVEHEVEPQHNTKVIPDCEYVDSTKNMCRKWNSGTQKCESYKCMFMNKELRRQATCKVCAYHYKGLCYRPDNAKQQEDGLEATHCFFFYPKDKNPERYSYIKNYCARFYYTQQVKSHEKQIKSREKSIKECNKELALYTVSEADRSYLEKKIVRKTQEISELEKELRGLTDTLNKLGERTETLPWTLAGKTAKKKQKNKNKKRH